MTEVNDQVPETILIGDKRFQHIVVKHEMQKGDTIKGNGMTLEVVSCRKVKDGWQVAVIIRDEIIPKDSSISTDQGIQ